ncbi:MAG: ArsC/Spx/MgsR family protein [Flavobacterium sp.]
MLQIFHNNRCGKSRNCLSQLESSGKQFEIISYLTNPPTAEELKIVLQKLSLSPIEIVRQKEKLWIDEYSEKTLSDEEIINILVHNPILIERPILVSEDKAIIAREDNKIENFLKIQTF